MNMEKQKGREFLFLKKAPFSLIGGCVFCGPNPIPLGQGKGKIGPLTTVGGKTPVGG